MKLYFKRKLSGTFSGWELTSYSACMAGLVSLLFLFKADSDGILSFAKTLTIVGMGICALCSAIIVYREIKRESSCNLYDLLRLLVSGALCIIALTNVSILT